MSSGKLILASRSPRRVELLSIITTDFKVEPSYFDERSINITDPYELVRTLSLSKASSLDIDSTFIVIGCDTVVYLDDEILGIPQNSDEAFHMLKKLSGKTHVVITGVTVLENNDIHQFECETKVTFLDISDDDIEEYIATDEPYDKAGGYGIQGKGALFVREIAGDYSNVVGLPVSKLNLLLNSLKKYEKNVEK